MIHYITDRLTQVLSAMTGATAVHLLVRPDGGSSWFLGRTMGDGAAAVPVEQAADQGELPLLALRYTERTSELLVVDDALDDDRFSADPYFKNLGQCSLLCAPIFSHGEVRAVLILENDQSKAAFNVNSLESITLIAGQLSVSLENALLYAALEDRVQRRTLKLEQANAELATALVTLERTKDELVRSEKLAALGSLVAGVAHELNTPIGVGVTVASAFVEKADAFSKAATAGLKRSDLEQFVADARFAAEILLHNLTRAGDLVRGFKQVAADHSDSYRGQFDLQKEVTGMLMSLGQTIYEAGCTFEADIEAGLTVDSYPAPLGQVVSELIANATIHGYGGKPGGLITMSAASIGDQEFTIEIRDFGNGIEAKNLKRVFEPFYTTRLGRGSSGLGLHIAHNIVTGVLGVRAD